ncbi:MAG: hypothetical protein H0U75_09985 [Legionella sp.]|nr:hypothetical protein [Legionella sp.]
MDIGFHICLRTELYALMADGLCTSSNNWNDEKLAKKVLHKPELSPAYTQISIEIPNKPSILFIL